MEAFLASQGRNAETCRKTLILWHLSHISRPAANWAILKKDLTFPCEIITFLAKFKPQDPQQILGGRDFWRGKSHGADKLGRQVISTMSTPRMYLQTIHNFFLPEIILSLQRWPLRDERHPCTSFIKYNKSILKKQF